MALKLLQGPITMYPDPADEQIASLDAGLTDECFWLDEVGLVGEPKDTFQDGNSWVCVNLNGMMSQRARRGSFNQDYTYISYDYTTNKLVGIRNFSDYLNQVEPINGTIFGQTGGLITDSHLAMRLEDRVIRKSGSQSLKSAKISTGIYLTEYVFPDPTLTNINGGNVMPGPGNTLYWYIGDAPGTIVHYDWHNRTEVQPQRRVTLGRTPSKLFYSLRGDFFIGIENNAGNSDITDMYIWANEVVPDSLTVPLALSPITEGRVSTIQVTLTGDSDEPIGGRFVDWSITAGNGTLSSSQSQTDEDGVATIDYIAPLTGGLDPTIEAEVTF